MRKIWKQKTWLTSLGLGLTLGSNLAQAAIYDRNGNKLPDAQVNSPNVNWELLTPERGKNYNAIGLLEQRGEGFCTAFFVNTGGDDKAPAYALTNGHCSDSSRFPNAQEILIDRPANLIFKLNYFKNGKERIRPVFVRRIVYATMKGTDITILQLSTTFGQLVKEGFIPLKIEQVPARVGEPVEVIGIPMRSVEPSLSFLHRVTCEVGESVKLREDVYHWDKSIRNRCSAVGGMSGSPMISLKNGRVVAIVNTAVDDEALSEPECSQNRPCEVARDGSIATFPEENYAQQVSNIPFCFDQKGIFNLNLPSCQLEKP
jgi:hypothetical protein